MFATKLKEYEKKLRKQGLKQGIEQGLEQGLEKGLEQGLMQGRKQGLEQGLEKGERLKAVEMARKMKAEGMDSALIRRITGLSAKDLKE